MSVAESDTSRDPAAGVPVVGAPIRVLVVDDHRDTRELYAEYFAHRGVLVDVASDGEDAVARARAFAPDVVVTDLLMPRGGGLHVLRALSRATRRGRPILVVLTSSSDDVLMGRARALGCDLLVNKPCSPADLLTRVVRALGARMTGGGG